MAERRPVSTGNRGVNAATLGRQEDSFQPPWLLRGPPMNSRTILILACLLLFVTATVTTSDATTTFGGSNILAVDEGQKTITFKTKEGQTWTLPVADSKLLTQAQAGKGDQVTIELNLNDQIIDVVKSSEKTAAPRTDSEDR